MAAATTAPSRHLLTGFAGFAIASAALIGVTLLGLGFVFRDPADLTAIRISAVLAWVTQLVAFPAVRKMTASNLMVGWGVGSLVRFGTLLVYALLGAFVLELSITAALVSLALFYFVTMVIEPLFLRP